MDDLLKSDIVIQVKTRSEREEVMDNFELKGKELALVLKDLRTVNKYLSGNKITLNGILKLIQGLPKEQEIKIVDVGCGNGEMLRMLARYGKKKNLRFRLTGVDANAHSIQQARIASADFPEINYMHQDVFSEEFKKLTADIFTCTLTLHHFKDRDINLFLSNLVKQSKTGAVINDLHRSKLAYRLFEVFSYFFLKSKIARHDGLVSILRGFKKKDLQKYAASLDSSQHFIVWKWAFRYQWIIKKNECKNSYSSKADS